MECVVSVGCWIELSERISKKGNKWARDVDNFVL